MLSQHLFWIWQAFSELSYRRGVGFAGPLPISYSDILAYCRLRDIRAASEKERLLRFIDVLDKVFMADAYKNAGKEAPTPPSKSERHRADAPRQRRRSPTKELVLP